MYSGVSEEQFTFDTKVVFPYVADFIYLSATLSILDRSYSNLYFLGNNYTQSLVGLSVTRVTKVIRDTFVYASQLHAFPIRCSCEIC